MGIFNKSELSKRESNDPVIQESGKHVQTVNNMFDAIPGIKKEADNSQALLTLRNKRDGKLGSPERAAYKKTMQDLDELQADLKLERKISKIRHEKIVENQRTNYKRIPGGRKLAKERANLYEEFLNNVERLDELFNSINEINTNLNELYKDTGISFYFKEFILNLQEVHKWGFDSCRSDINSDRDSQDKNKNVIYASRNWAKKLVGNGFDPDILKYFGKK